MEAPGPSRAERIKAIHDAFIGLMWVAKRQFAQRLQAFGLTPPQFMTLTALATHKQTCTMSDLTNATFQDAPTVTGIMDRLVKMNLVERTRSETDRRVVLVQATPAGVDLVKQVETQTLYETETSYAAMSDEELAHFEQLLKHILRTHLIRVTSRQDPDLDAEIEKLRLFKSDPIHFAKLESNKISPET
jgi:DNA-binding MarR family transcriptional regulator